MTSALHRALDRGAPGSDRLNEQVYDVISGAIADQTLRAGTLMHEGQLVKLLGASRAPVRQALGRLRDEGLLRQIAGEGYIVGNEIGLFYEVDLRVVFAELIDGDRTIRKAPGWEKIYEQVERSVIHRSAFGPARVNELELARHFGVGRLVARDVLTRLEILGMLEKDVRQRRSIVAVDAVRVTHLNELREHLEPAVLRHSCHKLARRELEAMRQRLMRQIEHYPHVDAATMNALGAIFTSPASPDVRTGSSSAPCGRRMRPHLEQACPRGGDAGSGERSIHA